MYQRGFRDNAPARQRGSASSCFACQRVNVFLFHVEHIFAKAIIVSYVSMLTCLLIHF